VTRLGDFAGITSMKFELASLALMNDDDQLAESILWRSWKARAARGASMPLSIALVRLGTILDFAR
jgi:hypothetical protein